MAAGVISVAGAVSNGKVLGCGGRIKCVCIIIAGACEFISSAGISSAVQPTGEVVVGSSRGFGNPYFIRVHPYLIVIS